MFLVCCQKSYLGLKNPKSCPNFCKKCLQRKLDLRLHISCLSQRIGAKVLWQAMFVESHSSQDVNLEGALKVHRPKLQIVADLASREGYRCEALESLRSQSLSELLWQARIRNHTKSFEGVRKNCIALAHQTEKLRCSKCVQLKGCALLQGKACPY